MHIELKKGKVKWYWNLVGRNGDHITSQKYFSKWSAKRSALKLANVNRYRIVEV